VTIVSRSSSTASGIFLIKSGFVSPGLLPVINTRAESVSLNPRLYNSCRINGENSFNSSWICSGMGSDTIHLLGWVGCLSSCLTSIYLSSKRYNFVYCTLLLAHPVTGLILFIKTDRIIFIYELKGVYCYEYTEKLPNQF